MTPLIQQGALFNAISMMLEEVRNLVKGREEYTLSLYISVMRCITVGILPALIIVPEAAMSRFVPKPIEFLAHSKQYSFSYTRGLVTSPFPLQHKKPSVKCVSEDTRNSFCLYDKHKGYYSGALYWREVVHVNDNIPQQNDWARENFS